MRSSIIDVVECVECVGCSIKTNTQETANTKRKAICILRLLDLLSLSLSGSLSCVSAISRSRDRSCISRHTNRRITSRHVLPSSNLELDENRFCPGMYSVNAYHATPETVDSDNMDSSSRAQSVQGQNPWWSCFADRERVLG
jgi:hypothetical protein